MPISDKSLCLTVIKRHLHSPKTNKQTNKRTTNKHNYKNLLSTRNNRLYGRKEIRLRAMVTILQTISVFVFFKAFINVTTTFKLTLNVRPSVSH